MNSSDIPDPKQLLNKLLLDLLNSCKQTIISVENITKFIKFYEVDGKDSSYTPPEILTDNVFLTDEPSMQSNELEQKPEQKPEQKINNEIDNDATDILNRRIALHKQLGTYKELNKKLDEEPDEETHYPTITPLNKLNLNEQKSLLLDIFNKAKHNVQVLLQISENDDEYQSQILKESDRLLNVWIEMNK
jgi:chorismate mutase